MAECREDSEPWPRAGGAAGPALSGPGEPGVAPAPGLPGLPWGARVSPRCARLSLWCSWPSGELRGVPGRVCSASPSPPPRRDWAAWPRRRPLSWLRFPEAADHPRGSYAREPRRLAAHDPQTWQSPSLRPLLAPSTKGSTSQRRRHVGLVPVPLWMWADRLWARAGWRRRSGGRCLRGSGLGEPLKGP